MKFYIIHVIDKNIYVRDQGNKDREGVSTIRKERLSKLTLSCLRMVMRFEKLPLCQTDCGKCHEIAMNHE